MSALLRESVSAFRPACFPLSLFFFHCVRLVSLLSRFLSPFLLVIVSALSPFLLVTPSCLPSVSFCPPSCLPSCWSLCPSCLPSCWSLCPSCLPSVSFSPPSCLSLLDGHCVRLVSLLFPFSLLVSLVVSVLSSFCFLLSPFLFPFLLVIVRVLSPFCVLLYPFLSSFLLVMFQYIAIVTTTEFEKKLTSILCITFSMSQKYGLGNASLLSHLFGVYGGVM